MNCKAYPKKTLDLCNQYNELIKDLFDSLVKINQGAWSGRAANNYVTKVEAERFQFEVFGDYLKYYGNAVKKAGENVDNTVNKWEGK